MEEKKKRGGWYQDNRAKPRTLLKDENINMLNNKINRMVKNGWSQKGETKLVDGRHLLYVAVMENDNWEVR